ncbi:MAG: efflux RND transporter periplasmic adaptor subunit [Gammaproteobacteria bacterium]|nr:efflux RND transporter periplasmic adaptor subunit [Gammaproteobacteria bacterium]
MKKLLLALLVISSIAVLMVVYVRDNTPKDAPSEASTKASATEKTKGERPTPVFTATVARDDMPVWIDALGRVTPRQQVVLRSRIDGELQKLHFNEGQFVKKGQLLAEIDPRALQTQLAQQKAQLAQQKALLDNAKRDLKRYDSLLEDDAIAAQQRDTQRSLVAQTQAALDNIQAQIKHTELQLSYTQIHAPLAGKIGFRQVDVGNQIKASDANGLATIVEIDPITVIFSLPEIHLPQLQSQLPLGQKMAVEIWNADKSQRLATSNDWISDNQVDAATGSIRLKAFVSNAQQQLTPNQFVQVRLQLDTLKQVLIIPSQAILYGAQGDYVYRVNADNKVETINVKRLHSTTTQIAIEGALNVGDILVTDGSDRLKPGSLVKASGTKADKKPSASESTSTQLSKE